MKDNTVTARISVSRLGLVVKLCLVVRPGLVVRRSAGKRKDPCSTLVT